MNSTTPARVPAARHPRYVTVLAAAVIVVVGVIVFGITVAKSSSFTAWETHQLASIAGARVPSLVDLSLALDRIFSPTYAALIGLIATVVVFLVSRRWGTAVHFVLLVAGTWLGSEVVKLIVHRPRPAARLADSLVPNPDQDSYPSGHVCFAVGLGCAIFVIAARSRARAIIAVLAILVAIVTAASRVYLGVHYPADAVVSLVYSAAAFIGIETLWRRFSDQLGLNQKRGSRAHRAARGREITRSVGRKTDIS